MTTDKSFSFHVPLFRIILLSRDMVLILYEQSQPKPLRKQHYLQTNTNKFKVTNLSSIDFLGWAFLSNSVIQDLI